MTGPHTMPAARSARVFAWLPLLFLMAGALRMVTPVLSSAALPNAQMPTRDSGVFLRVGRLILAGGIPYRDVRDYQPPAVLRGYQSPAIVQQFLA